MGKRGQERQGPITRFLVEDHRRLDALLQSAAVDSGPMDESTYHQFRAGLLRHIGMEEKILMPALQRLRGGAPFPVAAKLRLDHGAIAALLMPTPAAHIIAMIHGILAAHNVIEESPDGLYETCDMLPATEVDRLLADLQAAPEVNVMPYSDSPAVMNAVRRAVERAGYQFKG
jgi:Hemerythrin HHE cation binding domain